MTNTAEDHLPLSVPVYQILLSVSDRALHGYAVIQDVRARTDGEVELTASTLYGALRRMLDTGMVEEVDSPPDADADDPRRRYYAVTSFGRDVVRAEAARLERALAQARAKRVWSPSVRERGA